MRTVKIKTFLLAGIFCVWTGNVFAGGLSFNHNRMVYNEGSRSESITAKNDGDSVYLLQSGVITTPDGNVPGPFWVTPPIVRLDARSNNVLRIAGRPELLSALPHDRETVFYYFGNAIPAQSDKAGGENTAKLSIGIKTVLKLFWRPQGLKGDPQKVFSSLKVERRGDAVVVINPTPYYASFAVLMINGNTVDLSKQPSMIAPYGEVSFGHAGRVNQISWRLMTDYGGVTDEQKVTL